MVKKIYAYAHTHWDREWYQPRETFRIYLLSFLPQILLDLENGNLDCFYLDGQAVILEDVLEIAPELSERISALMSQGKLAAGPWYVLPDQMLVCGESLIRNLAAGMACVRRYGEPASVGYAPDTFGHSQDLPRILCGFGIKSCFLWRGVPPLKSGPCFWWESPDGSRVLSYHLNHGYYQTGLIEKSLSAPSDAQLDEYVEELCQFAGDKSQFETSELYDKAPQARVYPIGGDHTAPPRNLTEIMDRLNEKLKTKGLEVSLIQLSDFAELLRAEAGSSHIQMERLTGECRDNSAAKLHNNAYLLPGVLSSRLYLKQQNREAERRLFRFCEPLFSSLVLRGLMEYPQAELRHAARLLLQNHAHDSICGCSVDAVHNEMLGRYERIHQIIDPLLANAQKKLSGLPENSPLSADDPSAGLKRLRIINPLGRDFTGIVPLQWFSLPQTDSSRTGGNMQIIESRRQDQLFAGWGKVPYYLEVERFQGLIWIKDLPAFGELNLAWPLAETPAESESGTEPAILEGHTLDNGILQARVDENGQLSVIWTCADGQLQCYELNHILRDTADAGDTYNYDPLSGDSPVTARFVSVGPGKTGPLVVSLLLKYELEIAASLQESDCPLECAEFLQPLQKSANKVRLEIETEVLLKKASRLLEFETRFLNQSSGHRLDVLINTGYPVGTSFSENHFSLVARTHTSEPDAAEKLPVEAGCEASCNRFPAQRFFIANGQMILNRGLPEYGVTGDSVCLTLLRSVSILSRGRMLTRGGGAGPHVPVPGAECKGWNKAVYAWAPLSVFEKKAILQDSLEDDIVVEAYDLADAYEQEMFAIFSSQENESVSSLFFCDHREIRFLACYVSGDQNEVYLRWQNVSKAVVTCQLFVDFDFRSAHLCRLDEEACEEAFLYRLYVQADCPGSGKREVCALSIRFGANEIKTIRFRLQDDGLERRRRRLLPAKGAATATNSEK